MSAKDITLEDLGYLKEFKDDVIYYFRKRFDKNNIPEVDCINILILEKEVFANKNLTFEEIMIINKILEEI